MYVEIGPVGAGDVQEWARMARRVSCELRANPADLEGLATPDLLQAWETMVDRWSHHAALGEESFRWSGDLDVEQAEYMLHGIDRALHSPNVHAQITKAELRRHMPFTLHVVQQFVDALDSEGYCQRHLCDQVRASLTSLDH